MTANDPKRKLKIETNQGDSVMHRGRIADVASSLGLLTLVMGFVWANTVGFSSNMTPIGFLVTSWLLFGAASGYHLIALTLRTPRTLVSKCLGWLAIAGLAYLSIGLYSIKNL